DPDLPERYRRPEGWPEPMRQEYGSDQGLSAAKRHREALVTGFRDARRRLDEFAPDVVLIWGDDQYENFKEDIIPPFCVLAYESIEHRPWAEGRWQKAKNAWDEASDATFVYKGHRAAAKSLVTGLLDAGIDASYAYRPLHHPLGHAFMNTLLFLDYDRQGFPYPVIPFSINCYGRKVISQQGGVSSFADLPTEAQLDPPSPAPWRCFDLGRATARGGRTPRSASRPTSSTRASASRRSRPDGRERASLPVREVRLDLLREPRELLQHDVLGRTHAVAHVHVLEPRILLLERSQVRHKRLGRPREPRADPGIVLDGRHAGGAPAAAPHRRGVLLGGEA